MKSGKTKTKKKKKRWRERKKEKGTNPSIFSCCVRAFVSRSRFVFVRELTNASSRKDEKE